MQISKPHVIATTAITAFIIGVAAPTASAMHEHRTNQATSIRLDAAPLATFDSTMRTLPTDVTEHEAGATDFSVAQGSEAASTKGVASKLIAQLKKVPGYAKAVGGGFKSFKKWWDTKVPKAVKWSIKIAFGLDSAKEIWDEIK
ncbi:MULTISPECIES: hypothetical protein [Streptomyces]|uniref:hypothetical protein n=1 Tax=Streptomyces TaxID=1883 RepID=UPI001C264DD4|nr:MULTISPECIES: hypothetical protein [Streptomyces]